MVGLLHLRREGKWLRAKEVEPQIPVGLDLEVPLIDRRINCHLGYGVGV
jgi:hypothetical protein